MYRAFKVAIEPFAFNYLSSMESLGFREIQNYAG